MSERNIEVSIIIPVYNSEKTILNTINSILEQSYRNYEVIIVDDGSSDNTFKYIEGIIDSRSLNNFHIYKQKNGGPSSARNRGAEYSRGKYIAFLDSDDTWDKSKLSIQVEIHKNFGPCISGCPAGNSRVVNGDGDIIELPLDKLILKNYFLTSSIMVDRKIFFSTGRFDESFRYMEDWELWIRCAHISQAFIIDSTKYINYGDGKALFGESGLSGNLSKMFSYCLKMRTKLYNKRIYSKNRVMNILIYLYLYYFEYVRYIRRIFITKIRKFRSKS